MKKRIVQLVLMSIFAFLFLPAAADASNRVTVKYKESYKTYFNTIEKAYVCGKKVDLKKTPIFMKSGAYMGSLAKLFEDSALAVECSQSGNKMTLKYNGKTLLIKDGSRNAKLNGTLYESSLGSIAMKDVTYKGYSTKRWMVPVRSICTKLGIDYKVKNKVLFLGKDEGSASTAAENSVTKYSKDKVVVVLDPGHGGIDGGAFGKLYKEKSLNLAIVLAAKRYFDKDSRFKVYYTRTRDIYPSLDARCELANNVDAEIFISIHINSFAKASTGTETLYNKKRNRLTLKNGITSKSLGTYMQMKALDATGFYNRGVVNRTGLRVLNQTTMPACLIEYGFISNPKEEKIMHNKRNQYGRSLYYAIVSYMKAKGRIK